jgi:hypothetical protein
MPTGTLSRVRTHVRRLQQTTRNLKVSTTIKNEEQKTQEEKR